VRRGGWLGGRLVDGDEPRQPACRAARASLSGVRLVRSGGRARQAAAARRRRRGATEPFPGAARSYLQRLGARWATRSPGPGRQAGRRVRRPRSAMVRAHLRLRQDRVEAMPAGSPYRPQGRRPQGQTCSRGWLNAWQFLRPAGIPRPAARRGRKLRQHQQEGDSRCRKQPRRNGCAATGQARRLLRQADGIFLDGTSLPAAAAGFAPRPRDSAGGRESHRPEPAHYPDACG